MASSRKESSPYLGVQKSKSGGYAVEKRCFLYQDEDYGKFYDRTDDESRAAFISDVVDFFSRTNKSKFNFGNSVKVLEAHGPRLRRELEESLVSWGDLDQKERKEKVRVFLIDQANKLWNKYEGEILKNHIPLQHMGSSSNVVEQVHHGHEDSVQEQNHIPLQHMGSSSNVVEQVHHGHEDSVQEQNHIPLQHMGSSSTVVEQVNHGHEDSVQEQNHIQLQQMGSSSNVVEQVNHGHEDSVQKQNHIQLQHMGSSSNIVEQVNHGHEDSVQEQNQIRPLHKGINNNTLEQLDHGYEEFLAGEWSMTKQIEEHFYDNGGFLKFDIDVGLLQQPPPEEPKPKKKLPIPPSLKDPQGSCSQTQENPYEGIDARDRKTEQNLKSKMEQRCDGYAKWLEITDKFLKSKCSEVKVSFLLDQVAPRRKTLPRVCAQIQCALYEGIFDDVNDVIDSECIPKEILDKYRAETEPIVEQCRANWHS